jgi:hypothetical protein
MLMPLPIQAGLTCCAASLCIVVLYPVNQGSALLSLNSAINHIADSRITKRTVEMCQLRTSVVYAGRCFERAAGLACDFHYQLGPRS